MASCAVLRKQLLPVRGGTACFERGAILVRGTSAIEGETTRVELWNRIARTYTLAQYEGNRGF
jgi:hypothetical protein